MDRRTGWHAPSLWDRPRGDRGTRPDVGPLIRNGVDIPRAPAQRGRKQLLYSGLAVAAIVLATLGLHGLKPAAPRVDRAAVWIDSVQRGPLVIEVRGPGTLVPERIRYISAVTAGRVERRLAEAGEEVKPETVLLELSNPDVQLEALESERQLTVSRADQVNLGADLASQRLNQEAQVAARASRLSRRQAQRRGRRVARGQGADRAQRGQPRPRPGRGAGHPLQGRAGAAGGHDRRPPIPSVCSSRRRSTGCATSTSSSAAGSARWSSWPARTASCRSCRSRWAVGPERRHARPDRGARPAQGGAPHSRDPGQGRHHRPAGRHRHAQRHRARHGDAHRPRRAERHGDGGRLARRASCRAARGPTSRWTARSRSSGSTTCSTSAGRRSARPGSTVGLFKLTPGRQARRVRTRCGSAAPRSTRSRCVGGLQPGDQVILSDMSRWDGVDRVRVE